MSVKFFVALLLFICVAQGSSPCSYPAFVIGDKCLKSLDGGAIDQKITSASTITIPEGWVISPVVPELVSQASGAKCIAFDRATYATTDKSFNCKYRLSSKITCPEGVPRNAAGCVVTQDEHTRVIIMKVNSEEKKQLAARYDPYPDGSPPAPYPLASCRNYYMKPNASMPTARLTRKGDGWIVVQDENDCCLRCSARINSQTMPTCVGYQFVASVVNFQPYSTVTNENLRFNIGYKAGWVTSRTNMLTDPSELALVVVDYLRPGVAKLTNTEFVGSSIPMTNSTYFLVTDYEYDFYRAARICAEGNATCAGFTVVPNKCYLYSQGTWGDMVTGPQLFGSNVAFDIAQLYGTARIEFFQQSACISTPMFTTLFKPDVCTAVFDYNNNLIVYYYAFWNTDGTYDFGFYSNAGCTNPVAEGQNPWTAHYYNVNPQTMCRQSNIIKYVPSGKWYPTYWQVIIPPTPYAPQPPCFNNTC